jgi:hypothetical protein
MPWFSDNCLIAKLKQKPTTGHSGLQEQRPTSTAGLSYKKALTIMFDNPRSKIWRHSENFKFQKLAGYLGSLKMVGYARRHKNVIVGRTNLSAFSWPLIKFRVLVAMKSKSAEPVPDMISLGMGASKFSSDS